MVNVFYFETFLNSRNVITWKCVTKTDLLKQINYEKLVFFDYGELTSINSWLQNDIVMKLLHLQLYSKLKENCCTILQVISFIFWEIFRVESYSVDIQFKLNIRMTFVWQPEKTCVYPTSLIVFSLCGESIFQILWKLRLKLYQKSDCITKMENRIGNQPGHFQQWLHAEHLIKDLIRTFFKKNFFSTFPVRKK